jgi:hypothetical protein
MKYVSMLIAVVSMLFAAVPAQAAPIAVGDQLIFNGGGEDGADGSTPPHWNRTAGGFETYTGDAHGGSRRITVYSTGSGYQGRVYDDGFASNVDSLTLNGWIRGEGAGGLGKVTIEAGRWDGSSFTGGYEVNSFVNDGTTTWKDQSVSVLVHHGAVETNYFKVTLESTANCVYFDDISVLATAAVPEPGTLALCGIGLIGMLCYAWRKRP